MHPGVIELGFEQGASADADQRVVLTGVTWDQYEALLALFGDDQPGLRMAHLGGDLEILKPSRRHERIKTSFARLVEVFALERNVALTGLGSTTFLEAALERGAEPDECYCVGEEKDVPDIAFEVIMSSGGINKLRIYQGLGVPEVWFWRAGAFFVYALGPDGYQRHEASRFPPDIDVSELARLLERSDQTQAVREFRDRLRGQTPGT